MPRTTAAAMVRGRLTMPPTTAAPRMRTSTVAPWEGPTPTEVAARTEAVADRPAATTQTTALTDDTLTPRLLARAWFSEAARRTTPTALRRRNKARPATAETATITIKMSLALNTAG